MALLGRDLVALIQGTLESTSRREQQNIRERMARKVAEPLSRFGLALRALEVFDLLRRNEVKYGTARESGLEREKAVTEALMSWGIGSFSEANGLADQLHDQYKEFRTEFLNTRSITAHVGAVLRPFKRRYLDGWAEAGINDFSLAATEAEVARLSSMLINNADELRTWSKLVYRLFLKVAVLREDTYRTNSSVDLRPRKPMGMISSGSERTYSQQWTTWIDENAETLLEKSTSFGSFDFSTGFTQSSGLSQVDRDASFAQISYAASPLHSTQAPSTPIGTPATVVIRINDSEDPSLTAERSWLDRSSAESDVPSWIKNLLIFWGAERKVLIQLEFVLTSGESKFSLPVTELDSAQGRIVAALNAGF